MANIIPLHFEDTDIRAIERDGTPWLPAADIARALGYKHADAVSRIYRRNRDEFTDQMTATVKLTVPDNPMPIPVLIFSPRGAHLVGMFARTERAKAFRRWVLDVLDRETGATLTPAQKLALREAVAERVKTRPDWLTKAECFSAIYRALYYAFEVSSYEEIPAARFAEALAFVRAWRPTDTLPELPEPSGAPARNRDQLSFTARDSGGRLKNFAPGERRRDWHEGFRVGEGFAEEVANMVRTGNPCVIEQARLAACWGMNDILNKRGWGEECGFLDRLARYAVIGMRVARLLEVVQ